MGERASVTRTGRLWFWALLGLAVMLRALQFDAFAMHHPDEVLQYIEPAYRLVTGEGIVTWEYRYGMRGWLFPWLLAGPMAVGKAVGGSALAGIVAARIAAALVGLITVVAAWHLGRRVSTIHGIVAMAVMAVWYEQIVFSTHVLTETMATSLFLGGAALLGEKAGRGRVMAAGALLSLAVLLRFHVAPAIGIFLLLAIGTDWKHWTWLVLGSLPVAALSGTVDMIMGQWPFQWVWTNIQLNVVEGRAARFGVEPPGFYLAAIWDQWHWLSLPIVVLAVAAGRSYQPLLYAAAFNLAFHSIIGHKEYRFIELTSAVLLLLAAIGSVDAWRWLERRRGKAFAAVPALVGLLFIWAGASAWLGRNKPLDQWFGERSVGQELAFRAGRDPRVCGVATMTLEFWQLSRAYIGRPMPIVLLDQTGRGGRAKLKAPGGELASVNAVIAPLRSQPLLPGYSAVSCKGGDPYTRCLFVRPGGCTPTPEAEAKDIDKVMVKQDL